MTKTDRDTTSGVAGVATGAADAANTITHPANNHTAGPLLELTYQFI